MGLGLGLYYIFSTTPKNITNFRFYILALALIPFVSIIYSYKEFGQPILDGFKGTSPSLLWFFYFFLHRYKIKEGSFLKALFFISIFFLGVQIIQQFTYPHVLFGVSRNLDDLDINDEITSNRNGLWRFKMGDVSYIAAILVFAFWCDWQKKMENKKLIPIILLLASIYLTLTRQLIFSSLLTLFASYFNNKTNKKIWMWIIGLLTAIILYYYYDLLFGEFVAQTEDELSDSYIRILAANYFWKDTFSSISAMFLGHGVAFSGAFAQFQDNLRDNYHYYLSDVGFIGMMWKFGIIYVPICYALLIDIVWKKRHILPPYIRLFAIFSTIPSMMIFPFANNFQTLFWCFLLYYCDLYINKEKSRVINNSNIYIAKQ